MNATVSLHDDFAARFEPERGRRVLEVLALNEDKAHPMSRAASRKVPGFGTRGERDGVLRERGGDDGMTVEAFDHPVQELDRIGL